MSRCGLHHRTEGTKSGTFIYGEVLANTERSATLTSHDGQPRREGDLFAIFDLIPPSVSRFEVQLSSCFINTQQGVVVPGRRRVWDIRETLPNELTVLRAHASVRRCNYILVMARTLQP